MKRIALALTVAALVAASGSSNVFSEDEPLPTGLAFLNVHDAVRDLGQRKVMEEAFIRRDAGLDTKLRADLAALEELADDLVELNEGSDDYLRKQRDIDIGRLTIKRDREFETDRLQRDMRRAWAGLYRTILREAQAVAEGRGLAAVFLESDLGPEFEKSQNMDLLMGTRTVLWSDSRLDITREVVERLNEPVAPGPKKPDDGG